MYSSARHLKGAAGVKGQRNSGKGGGALTDLRNGELRWERKDLIEEEKRLFDWCGEKRERKCTENLAMTSEKLEGAITNALDGLSKGRGWINSRSKRRSKWNGNFLTCARTTSYNNKSHDSDDQLDLAWKKEAG